MQKVNDQVKQQDQVNQSQPLATERSETLRAAQGDGQSCVAPHPAAMAIRNEVYDAALAELCDPDVLDDPDQAGRLATAIANRTLLYLSTKTVEEFAHNVPAQEMETQT